MPNTKNVCSSASDEGYDFIRRSMLAAAILPNIVLEQPEGDAQRGVQQDGGLSNTVVLQPAYRGHAPNPVGEVDCFSEYFDFDALADSALKNDQRVASDAVTLPGPEVEEAVNYFDNLQANCVPVSQVSATSVPVTASLPNVTNDGEKVSARGFQNGVSDGYGSENEFMVQAIKTTPKPRKSSSLSLRKTSQAAKSRVVKGGQTNSRAANSEIEVTPTISYKLHPMSVSPARTEILRRALTEGRPVPGASNKVPKSSKKGTKVAKPQGPRRVGGKGIKLPATSTSVNTVADRSTAVFLEKDKAAEQRRTQSSNQNVSPALISDSGSESDFENIFSQADDNELFKRAFARRRHFEQECKALEKSIEREHAAVRSVRRKLQEFDAELQRKRQRIVDELTRHELTIAEQQTNLDKARKKVKVARRVTNFKFT